ncbi:unnamed protein product, partial [Scytosiphon promiscuus]
QCPGVNRTRITGSSCPAIRGLSPRNPDRGKDVVGGGRCTSTSLKVVRIESHVIDTFPKNTFCTAVHVTHSIVSRSSSNDLTSDGEKVHFPAYLLLSCPHSSVRLAGAPPQQARRNRSTVWKNALVQLQNGRLTMVTVVMHSLHERLGRTPLFGCMNTTLAQMTTTKDTSKRPLCD